MSENAYERTLTHLGTAVDEVDSAVEAVRELDQIMPASRRRVVAALDDANAELQRFAAAFNRVLERSQGASALPTPDEAAAVQRAIQAQNGGEPSE